MNIFQGKYLNCWVESGVFFGQYKHSIVDLKVGEGAVDDRLSFMALNSLGSMPAVVDYRRVRTTTKEARDYFVTEKPSRLISAMGIVINSMVAKTIANFYLRVNRPPYPTKVFNDQSEAIAWLQKFRS